MAHDAIGSDAGWPPAVRSKGHPTAEAVAVRVGELRSRKTLQRGLGGAYAKGRGSIWDLGCGIGEGLPAVANPKTAARILGQEGGPTAGSPTAEALTAEDVSSPMIEPSSASTSHDSGRQALST